jgi:hypothetical protein
MFLSPGKPMDISNLSISPIAKPLVEVCTTTQEFNVKRFFSISVQGDARTGNDEPAMDLYPVEERGGILAEARTRKRKRRMIVDDILELAQKDISRALKDTSDIVLNLDQITRVKSKNS